MCDTSWGEWLRATTGGKSSRDLAARVSVALQRDVSHTTIQRWMKSGIPPDVVFELSAWFKVDPTTAVIQMGWMTLDDVRRANLGFLMPLIPTETLTAELHRRALEARPPKLEEPPPRTTGVPIGRSDSMRHQSFRLTAK